MSVISKDIILTGLPSLVSTLWLLSFSQASNVNGIFAIFVLLGFRLVKKGRGEIGYSHPLLRTFSFSILSALFQLKC